MDDSVPGTLKPNAPSNLHSFHLKPARDSNKEKSPITALPTSAYSPSLELMFHHQTVEILYT